MRCGQGARGSRGRPLMTPRALRGVRVGAEAQEARAVAEALLLHLVEADFAHQLGAHLMPWKVAALRPARAAAGDASPFLRPMGLLAQRGEQLLQLVLERLRNTGGVPDEI